MHAVWDSYDRRKVVLVGLSVLVGSILIILLVVSLPPGDSPMEETFLLTENEATTSQFINVVIFGVNQLHQQPTVVEAVWIGTFDQANNEGVLLGLPYTFGLNNGLSMAQSFSWLEENQLDPTFITAVQETLALDIDTVLVMDRDCFQASIDFIGGLPMETGQDMDGSAALALHAMSANDPWLALEVQAEILSNARQRLHGLGHQPDLTALFDLTPEHCWFDMSDEAALNIVMDMFPLNGQSIRIDTIADTN